jgi:exopolyphosphatase/guanosine-5'-triphosphate,3'-diphosphate pyrophosphatase
MTAMTTVTVDDARYFEVERQAVIDLGSNSIRLVIFEGLCRAPTPIFNERALCGVGRGLRESGLLHPEGVAQAVQTISRFVELSRASGAGDPEIVATAAVREAGNGDEFVATILRVTGVGVRILSGAEEAHLSALGALSAVPGAEGVVGDLGGGSLELVRLSDGHPAESVTLPLGPLRLAGMKAAEKTNFIDEAVERVAWLDSVRDKPIFAVGGAWRSLARIHMAQRNYPLRIVHQYRIDRSEANMLAKVIGGLSPGSLALIEGVNKRRLEALPEAALVLSRVMRKARPSSIVFLAGGLREGIVHERLTDDVRAQDPLIAQCRAIATMRGRYGDTGDLLCEWMATLYSDESAEQRRHRLASCLLSDIAWRDHPTYRARQAFEQILHAPFVGIDHAGRAFVSMAVHARYAGASGDLDLAQVRGLVDEATMARAKRIGLCLRLAMTLSGGSPSILRRTRLERDAKKVVLKVDQTSRHVVGDIVERRLAAVGKASSLAPRVEVSAL